MRPPLITDTTSLLFDDRAGIVACDVEERDALVFPLLLRGSLRSLTRSIFFLRVEVRPFNPTDFVLAHRSRDGKADDPPNGNFLKAICLESRDQTIQFILCRRPSRSFPFPTRQSRASAMRAKTMGSTESTTP
jgi:hypothetical protein